MKFHSLWIRQVQGVAVFNRKAFIGLLVGPLLTGLLSLAGCSSVDNRRLANIDLSAPAQPLVVMYSASWCGPCKKAKRYFKSKNIPFVVGDIERDSWAREGHQKLGGGGIPLIVVGDQTLRGFSPSSFQAFYKRCIDRQNSIQQ